MKRVLVTGATGGLGRNAVRLLLERGVAVRATGRNAGVGRQLTQQGAEFSALDLALATPDQLDTLMAGVDTVWHCAALSSPWGERRDFLAANVRATSLLLACAGKHGVRSFIHISTPALYFDYRHHFDVPETFRPAAYANHYARSKAAAEQLVQQAVARFPAMTSVILRPRAIFGPHDQVLLPRLLRLRQRCGGKLPLPGGGTALLDLTYVDNVVHAMCLASEHIGLQSGAVFNIGNHEPVRLRDALQSLFQDGSGRPLRIIGLPYPLLAGAARCAQALARVTGREPSLTRYSVGVVHYHMTLDNTKAIYLLGYRPPVSLEDGIARTAAWLKGPSFSAQS